MNNFFSSSKVGFVIDFEHGLVQISANQGPALSFLDETNTETLNPKVR